MFATLLGALPRPAIETDDTGRLVEAAVRAQEEASLEPITDGRLRGAFDRLPSPEETVNSWRATAVMTDRAVKVALPGPLILDGVDGARLHAPCFGALKTGVRRIAGVRLERRDPDDRLGGLERACLHFRTSQLAAQTACAAVWRDMQHLGHGFQNTTRAGGPSCLLWDPEVKRGEDVRGTWP